MTMKLILNQDESSFWRLAIKKSFVTMGFTFFSSLVALQIAGIESILPVFYTSFIGAGSYLFAELMRYYGLNPEKKVTNKKTKVFSFLI